MIVLDAAARVALMNDPDEEEKEEEEDVDDDDDKSFEWSHSTTLGSKPMLVRTFN
jgi:hypothetical protein